MNGVNAAGIGAIFIEFGNFMTDYQKANAWEGRFQIPAWEGKRT